MQQDNLSAEGASSGESGGSTVFSLLQLQTIPNIADQLDAETLTKLGRQVVRDAAEDDASRKDWLKRAEEAMDAALQVSEEKTFPWPDSANVKYPLLTVAALQFHARAYGAIVPGKRIVKAAVTGADPTGEKAQSAERISTHMSYQLLDEMPEWVEDMDKMLLALPIEGHEFKKSYFDKSRGRNVSEWVRPADLIVNQSAKSLEVAPRITHVIRLFPYEIAERMRAGTYIEHDNLVSTTDEEKEAQQEIYEQHMLYDLDDDGVKEPWICTVHKDTEKVLRIVAGYEPDGIIVKVQEQVVPLTQIPPQFLQLAKLVKVEREQYFTSFPFLPSPDGGFYGVGFGQLIGPLSGVIDSLTNQILDAGTDANAGGGFYAKSLKGPKGTIYKSPGEWIAMDVPTGQTLRDALVPNIAPGPSTVSFTLLDFLMGAVKQVTSTSEIMTGDAAKATMPVGTTMALIEQGLATYSAIYLRIYRALKKEFKRIRRLNGIFLQPESYYTVLDTGDQGQVFQQDYQSDGTDVQPVADPNASTTMQKIAKAQAALQMAQGNPHVNAAEATKLALEAMDMPVERLWIQQPPAPPPDPDKEASAQLKLAQAEKTMAEAERTLAEIERVRAEALRAIADAEAKEVGAQLDIYRVELEALRGMNDQGRNSGMETPPGNGMVPQGLEGIPPELLGAAIGMPMPGQFDEDPNAVVPELGTY